MGANFAFRRLLEMLGIAVDSHMALEQTHGAPSCASLYRLTLYLYAYIVHLEAKVFCPAEATVVGL
jgi:hypothetical protein